MNAFRFPNWLNNNRIHLLTAGMIIASCLLFNIGKSQPVYKLWDKTIGGNKNERESTTPIITPSRKIILACVSNSDAGFDKSQNSYPPTPPFTQTQLGTWLMCLDSTGHIIWDKVVGGAWGTIPLDIAMENPNSFYLLARIENIDTTYDLTAPVKYPSNNPGSQEGRWLMHFDSSGNILDNERFVCANGSFFSPRISINADKLYIFGNGGVSAYVGGDFSLPNWCPGIYNGGIISVRKGLHDTIFDAVNIYGGSTYTSYLFNKRGNIVLSGSVSSPAHCTQTVSAYPAPNGQLTFDYYVLEADSSGNILWQHNYGGDSTDYAIQIVENRSSGYYLFGTTVSKASYDISQNGYQNNITTGQFSSYWLLRLDSLGNKIWDRRISSCNSDIGSYYGFLANYSINTDDDAIIMIGCLFDSIPCADVSEYPKGQRDYWAIKIDSLGNKVWDKRFGGPAGSGFLSISITTISRGVYLLTGYGGTGSGTGVGNDKSEPDRGGGDIWMICFADSSLIQALPPEKNVSSFTVGISPNPVNDHFTLNIKDAQPNNEYIISVTDVLGQVVYNSKTTTITSTIHCENWKAGMYYVKIQDGSKASRTIKLLKD